MGQTSEIFKAHFWMKFQRVPPCCKYPPIKNPVGDFYFEINFAKNKTPRETRRTFSVFYFSKTNVALKFSKLTFGEKNTFLKIFLKSTIFFF